MVERKRSSIDGFVVTDGNYLKLKDRRGGLHSIPQTQALREIADTNTLCVFNRAKTSYESDDFWELDEVIGEAGDPTTEITAMAKARGCLKEIPYKVRKQIEMLPDVVGEQDRKDYKDLRHIPFVTIDPDNAGDFDDAVYAKKNKDGSYTLKVAIANVAHYIKPGTPAYNYAIEKGNSVYMGWIIDHMFMTKLSHGTCSINEGEDRLVMCTTMTITPDGNVKDFLIEPAVIKSRHRLTYKEADFLYFGENAEGDTEDHRDMVDKCKDVMESLGDLYEVSYAMYKERMKRGSFDIETPELEYKMDEDKKKVIRYAQAHNEDFTSVIEETAVRTNEIWGDVSLRLNVPLCYRNHGSIDFDRIPAINGRLAQFGLHVPNSPQSKDIQKVFDSVKGKRIEEYVVHMLLKAMDRAYYSGKNEGHVGLAVSPHRFVQFEIEENKGKKKEDKLNFQEKIDEARMNYFKKTGSLFGLAFDGDITHGAYCHSTSPIRRGPDLDNQNQMLSLIMNDRLLFTEHDIQNHCDNFNNKEYNAQMAESEISDYLMGLWAQDNIGKIFERPYVVSIGEHAATLVSDDGFRMSVSYDDLGIRRKHLKIGQVIDRVAISSVSFHPTKIMGTRILNKKLESDAVAQSDEAELYN